MIPYTQTARRIAKDEPSPHEFLMAETLIIRLISLFCQASCGGGFLLASNGQNKVLPESGDEMVWLSISADARNC